jgi:uncharacterized protein YjbI with pentapeptide repeats
VPTPSPKHRLDLRRAGRDRCRAPAPVVDLEPLELDGLADHDGWSERHVTGSAVAADAQQVSFGRSTFTGFRLTAAQLFRLDLVDVTLTDCDLAGVVFEDASFNRVALVGCRLNGADLGGASLVDVRFADCQLDEAAFRMVRTERLVVTGGSARRIDCYRAKVAGSDWHGVDLTGADLSGADFSRAHLHGSTIADLTGAKALAGSVIDPAQEFSVGGAVLADLGIVVDDDPDWSAS